MSFLQFFFPYFMHLFFGAFVICGWFAITRGSKELLPNGGVKLNGKILKGWYFYWFQETGTNIIYYSGEHFEKIYLQANNMTSNKLLVSRQAPNHLEVIGEVNLLWKVQVEQSLGIKILVKKDGDKTLIFFGKEYPVYKYPEWVRDMLAGCITCHSSWLGSICFWLPILLSKSWAVQLVYGFTENTGWALFYTWIAYCVSLAFITTGLWKKYMA